MSTTFSHYSEVLAVVAESIEAGGAATRDEYDLEAIAAATFTYNGSRFVATTDPDEFWDVVEAHAKVPA